MKAKHHFWSSLAAGGALYWVTGSSAALAGSMVGGFLIDADHIIDQLWSIKHGAPFRRRRAVRDSDGATRPTILTRLDNLIRPRELLRLPLVFHSYELLAAIAVLTLCLRTPFWIGLLFGYVLHVTLDIFRHFREFRSPLFYLFSYRLSRGFRRDQLIKRKNL